MGWSLGFDTNWNRNIGYGVPAYCDHPDCNEEIDRGLANVCANQEPRGGDGCGLYFCDTHKGFYRDDEETDEFAAEIHDCCERCRDGKDPFDPKPDHPDWIRHKLTDESWADWRFENPDWVEEHGGER